MTKKEHLDLQQRLQKAFENWVKPKHDHQLLQTLLEKEKVDEDYLAATQTEIFNRSKN